MKFEDDDDSTSTTSGVELVKLHYKRWNLSYRATVLHYITL